MGVVVDMCASPLGCAAAQRSRDWRILGVAVEGKFRQQVTPAGTTPIVLSALHTRENSEPVACQKLAFSDKSYVTSHNYESGLSNANYHYDRG